MTPLAELIGRVEKATGGSYDLSRDIGEFFGAPTRYEHPGSANESHRNYTSSLDAVIALAEAQLPNEAPEIVFHAWRNLVYEERLHTDFRDIAKNGTLVQALARHTLLAFLRAKEKQSTTGRTADNG